MAFRPHHTCFLLLGIVLVLTILDCFVLSSYPTSLAFVESETCEETTISLPQTGMEESKESGDHVSLVQFSEGEVHRWSYYVCGPADQDFPNQKINTPAKVQTEDEIIAAESQFTLDTKETSTSFQCISGVTRCRQAGMLDEDTLQDASVTLGPKQYLIQIDDVSPGFPNRLLVLFCFAIILAGLFYGWHHTESMPKPRYSVYNGIEAFVVATFIGSALARLIYSFMPQGDGNVVPLFTMSMAQMGMFVGLFATAGFFIFLKTKRPYREDCDNDKAVCQPDDDADADEHLPFFCKSPMKWSILFGLILAILAAIFALNFDEIEMTTGDLSNEFTVYRLSLMHFAMMAGISEELLYRGVVQTAIGGRKRHGIRAMLGVWIAALLFAGVHIPQSLGHLFTLLPVFMVGLTSGYFRCKTQSIFPSMTMHLTYNSILMLPSLFFI